MCLCVYMLIAQLSPTLWDPMDCSPPGFSVHVILQAGILEWVAILKIYHFACIKIFIPYILYRNNVKM